MAALVGGILGAVLLLVAIAFAIVCCKRRQADHSGNATPRSNTLDPYANNYGASPAVPRPTTATTTNQMYSNGTHQVNAAVYAIPMEANEAGDGRHAGATVYATVVGDPIVGGNNNTNSNYDVAVHRQVGGPARTVEYSHLAPAGSAANYDVAVHQQRGGSAGSAEYSHLAPRNDIQQYSGYAPPQGVLENSTVYATAANDQYAVGSAANYDVAVHQQGVGPAGTAEYSHLALRNDAGGQQQQSSNNHYDVGNPRAARRAAESSAEYASVA